MHYDQPDIWHGYETEIPQIPNEINHLLIKPPSLPPPKKKICRDVSLQAWVKSPETSKRDEEIKSIFLQYFDPPATAISPLATTPKQKLTPERPCTSKQMQEGVHLPSRGTTDIKMDITALPPSPKLQVAINENNEEDMDVLELDLGLDDFLIASIDLMLRDN